MSLAKDVRAIKKLLEEIKNSIVGEESKEDELLATYKEYKFFADSRGMKLLEENGLVDEYNSFMSECEKIIFSTQNIMTLEAEIAIELPKPSPALEAFKNKFNKFF